MIRIVAFYDEGAVCYVDRARPDDVDIVDVPDELLAEWENAQAALRAAERRIFALMAEQHPTPPPKPPEPETVKVEPTAPSPVPRTLDQYQRDQEG